MLLIRTNCRLRAATWLALLSGGCTSPHIVQSPDSSTPVAEAGTDGAISDAGRDGASADEAGEPDGGGDAGAVDSGAASCSCPGAGELCTLEGACVSYCEFEMLPGSLAGSKPPPILCTRASAQEPDLTFAQICSRRCQLQCRLQDWFCGAKCPPEACAEDDAAMLAACSDDCGAEANPSDCLQWSCEATRGLSCIDTVCPDGGDPRCDGIRCSNTCSSLNFDGWCDDGDTFNTSDEPGSLDSALCSWGTDCADCGPRNVADGEPVNIPIGGQCHFNSRCEGHLLISVNNAPITDLAINESWCAKLNQPVADNYRCVPDASGEGETCPAGYDMVMMRDSLGEPLMMNGLVAMACIPRPGTCE